MLKLMLTGTLFDDKQGVDGLLLTAGLVRVERKVPKLVLRDYIPVPEDRSLHTLSARTQDAAKLAPRIGNAEECRLTSNYKSVIVLRSPQKSLMVGGRLPYPWFHQTECGKERKQRAKTEGQGRMAD